MLSRSLALSLLGFSRLLEVHSNGSSTFGKNYLPHHSISCCNLGSSGKVMGLVSIYIHKVSSHLTLQCQAANFPLRWRLLLISSHVPAGVLLKNFYI